MIKKNLYIYSNSTKTFEKSEQGLRYCWGPVFYIKDNKGLFVSIKRWEAVVIKQIGSPFKESVYPKLKIPSSFTHPHVVTNLRDFFFFCGTQNNIFLKRVDSPPPQKKQTQKTGISNKYLGPQCHAVNNDITYFFGAELSL